MEHEPNERTSLILFIKTVDPFYTFTDLGGHSLQQLKDLKTAIEWELEKKSVVKLNYAGTGGK